METTSNIIYATPSKIAALFGLNQGSLANMRCKKTGPPYIKIGEKVLYKIAEVTKWLQAQNHTH